MILGWLVGISVDALFVFLDLVVWMIKRILAFDSCEI